MSEEVSVRLARKVEIMLLNAGANCENFWVPVSESLDLARKIVAFVHENKRTISQVNENSGEFAMTPKFLEEIMCD